MNYTKYIPNLFFPIGGGDEIGASSYFLQLDETKFLLDSGIRLGSNDSFPRFSSLYETDLLDGLWDLNAILISHGHLDHVGALPTVIEQASGIPIYTTLPTKDIMEVQLEPRKADKTFIDVQAVNEFNKRRSQQVIENIRLITWDEPIQIGNCQITFFPAGHILGASMIYIESDSGNVLFSGDFTDFDQMTVHGYRLPDDLEIDLLIAESTYGYQKTSYTSDIMAEREIFASKVTKCLEEDGSVLIPAFAIGRSQEVMLILQSLMSEGKLQPFTIYVDGLAQHFCEIYEHHGVKVFGSCAKKARRSLVHQLDNFNGVIIASSGMLLDNSASAKYAEKLLPNRQNRLFFSGYLDEESPGGRLNLLNESEGKTFRLNGKNVPVNAIVDTYRLSAHVDGEGILALIEEIMPKNVIFVHGMPQYRTETNVFQETCRRFPRRISVHQASNGIPIYF